MTLARPLNKLGNKSVRFNCLELEVQGNSEPLLEMLEEFQKEITSTTKQYLKLLAKVLPDPGVVKEIFVEHQCLDHFRIDL